MFIRGAIFLSILILTGCKPSQPLNQISDAQVLDAAKQLVSEHYIEPVDVSGAASIDELVELLPDRYSRHLSIAEYHDFTAYDNGEYYGLGFSFEMDGALPVVTKIFPGSPADQSGIRPGEEIVAINTRELSDMNREEIDSLLNRDTSGYITVSMRFEKELRSVSLRKDYFALKTIEYRVLDQEMGYLKISAFLQQTQDELLHVIDQLLEDNITQLVIDLRGNNGGISGSSLSLVEALVPSGDMVRYSDSEGQVKIAQVSGNGVLTHMETVILVNRFTASEAEVLTAALSDNGRAVVVGETTYGKGLLTETYTLPDGSGLQLATGSWQRPTGDSVERVGITPAIEGDDIQDWSQVPWAEVW